MSILDKFKKKKDDKAASSKHYLSGKEIRAIAKSNAKITRKLEKEKKRRLPESEYTSQMKDDNNILEIENLGSIFIGGLQSTSWHFPI